MSINFNTTLMTRSSLYPFHSAQLRNSCQQGLGTYQLPWEQDGSSMIGPGDGFRLSSGAQALMLLRERSSCLSPLMGQDLGLPYQPDFGEPRPDMGEEVYPEPDPGALPQAAPSPRPQPTRKPEASLGGAKVRPLTQSNGVSCGQTSAAMCINSLTGKNLTDRDINSRYGFSLLSALNSETRGSGYRWSDAGDLTAKSWPSLERRLNKDHTPVMIGLNGQFSSSGRGHIVTLLSVDGNKVTYADPADGKVKTTTKQAIENAPGHPHGKFLFVADKA